VAQLTCLTESACVIDFGLKQPLLLAYCEPDANRAIAPESSVLSLPLITEVGPDDAFKVLHADGG
jgi:hypothetical protein